MRSHPDSVAARAARLATAPALGQSVAAIARPDLEREVLRLRERNRELEEAVKARDEFVATLGHELRNPLSPIFLQVAFLTEQVRSADGGVIASEWLLPKLDGFSKRLQRLLDILNRLMDISRIGAGEVPIQIEDMDLAETTREVCASYEREVAAAGCRLEVRANTPVSGRWDRTRIEQILRNLLSNAIRYGAQKPITIEVSASGDQATLSVRDRGIGIASEELARIFERFERGGGQQHRTGGFGLGLWITRKLCAAMGGDIEVESELGHGSTFVVSLPRATGDCR